MGDVNWQMNEDLYDMKYVVRYLCSEIVTVVNPQGRNETDHGEWGKPIRTGDGGNEERFQTNQ
jgi:hypothetical protein